MFQRKRRPHPAGPPPPAPGPDPSSYDAVAEVYDRVRAPVHEDPARDLVSRVSPAPGDRVLDVGTGTGVAAEAALRSVGEDGLVIGADPSFGMLSLARRRGIRVVGAQAIDLPFADAAFDAVVANFVIFVFRRYDTALFDMVRVLRPGGRFGATTWGGVEDEFRRVWREVAESFAGRDLVRDAVRRAAPWQERFSRPDGVKEALWEAGLRQVEVEHREYRHTVSLEDYLAGRETTAVGRSLRVILSDALWARFRERVREEFRSRFPDPIGDTSDVLLAVGTKP